MFKSILLLSFFISSSTFALCGNDQIVLQVVLTGQTSDTSYVDGISQFTIGDFVEVYEMKTKQSFILNIGQIEDDTAGNYDVSAKDGKGRSISLYHDHETWHSDGLGGSYTSSYGEVIDLADVICEFDDLFL